MKSSTNHSSPISVAVAGLGFGEKVHIPAIRANSGLQLSGLWHPKESRLNEASKHHEVKAYSNWERLLNDKNIEAIVIATPPEPRFKLALEALNAGKHLFLEKPVALCSEDIAKLQILAMEKKLSVAVNFEYRAVPIFMQAQKMLSKGVIGTPWLTRLDWLMSSRANEERPWNWYSQKEKGGGVIGALGTHAFDIIDWLCGPIRSVNSLLSTSIKVRPEINLGKGLKVTSEDIALAQIEIKSRNDNQLSPAQISLSSVSREGRGFLLEIYGSKGTLTLSSSNQKDYVHGFNLSITSVNETTKAIMPNTKLMFPKTWADGRIAPVSRVQEWWVHSIRNGIPMIPGLMEGMTSQKVCDKMKESSIIGQKINL